MRAGARLTAQEQLEIVKLADVMSKAAVLRAMGKERAKRTNTPMSAFDKRVEAARQRLFDRLMAL